MLTLAASPLDLPGEQSDTYDDKRESSLPTGALSPKTGKKSRKKTAEKTDETAPADADSPRKKTNEKYRVYPRGDRWHMSFTCPYSKERVREKCCEEGHKSATTSESKAWTIARTEYGRRLERAQLRGEGSDLGLDLSFETLSKKYLTEQQAKVRAGGLTASYYDDLALSLRRVGEHTSFGQITNMNLVNTESVTKLAEELFGLDYVPLNILRAEEKALWLSKKEAPDEREAIRTLYKVPFTPGMVRTHLLACSGLVSWLLNKVSTLSHKRLNPFIGHIAFRDLAPGRDDDHFYTIEQMTRLLATARGRVFSTPTKEYAKGAGFCAIIYVLAYTGARIDEVLRLTPSAIDFENDTITFNSAKKGQKKNPALLKNRSKNETGRKRSLAQRTLPLWPALKEVLVKYFADWRPHSWALLFPGYRYYVHPVGTPTKRSKPYSALETLCRHAEVPYKSGHHVFRHTWLSVRSRMQTIREDGKPGGPVATTQVKYEAGHTINDRPSENGRANQSTMDRVYMKAIEMPGIAAPTLDYLLINEMLERGLGTTTPNATYMRQAHAEWTRILDDPKKHMGAIARGQQIHIAAI